MVGSKAQGEIKKDLEATNNNSNADSSKTLAETASCGLEDSDNNKLKARVDTAGENPNSDDSKPPVPNVPRPPVLPKGLFGLTKDDSDSLDELSRKTDDSWNTRNSENQGKQATDDEVFDMVNEFLVRKGKDDEMERKFIEGSNRSRRAPPPPTLSIPSFIPGKSGLANKSKLNRRNTYNFTTIRAIAKELNYSLKQKSLDNPRLKMLKKVHADRVNKKYQIKNKSEYELS